MNAKQLWITGALVISLGLAQTGSAASVGSTAVKVADAVIVRPLGFTSMLVGGVLFTLSLPVTAPMKQTRTVADLLVVKPAEATFVRPLGDMEALGD